MNENFRRSESEHARGVLSVTEENRHYVISIRWVDGTESTMYVPMTEFDVVNPQTHHRIRKLTGKEAVQILKDHTAELHREEFSWEKFLPEQK